MKTSVVHCSTDCSTVYSSENRMSWTVCSFESLINSISGRSEDSISTCNFCNVHIHLEVLFSHLSGYINVYKKTHSISHNVQLSGGIETRKYCE